MLLKNSLKALIGVAIDPVEREVMSVLALQMPVV